jgi:hypothetical protein
LIEFFSMTKSLLTSIVFATVAFTLPSTLVAQQPAPPPLLDSALVAAFQGSWHCAGAFANGNKIESDATFTVDLDRHWLRLVQDDRPPNGYHALSMWGADASTGKWMSMIFDNFGGARKFTSAGWDGHGIELYGAPGPRRERFMYAVESTSSYRMRYEVSADGGGTWRLGDELLCTRS